MKILILRFSSLGDIILTTPVIRNLKNQLKDCEIHYATRQQNAFLLEKNPYISKVHTLKKNDAELISQLKLEGFDQVIDLHRNIRTFRIKQALRVKSVSFNKLNIRKFILVNFSINLLPKTHIVDRYMKTVAHLGIRNDNKGLDYFINKKDEINMAEFNLTADNYIAYGIGGQHFTKRLPKEKILQLLRKINGQIVLLGGKEDQETANYVKANLGSRAIDFCGKISLNQSAFLVANAAKVISHDTAVMHIAAAFKKEVISIWGNTVPAFGMYPYQTKFTVIENNFLTCRPCSKIGYDSCPKGHFRCMNDLDFKELNA